MCCMAMTNDFHLQEMPLEAWVPQSVVAFSDHVDFSLVLLPLGKKSFVPLMLLLAFRLRGELSFD